MITVGTKSQVVWGKGNWLFCDIGFASQAKSCGLALGDEEPHFKTFGNTCLWIADSIGTQSTPVNVVIEAPLSIAFNKNGNPTGRKFETDGDNHRYWYVGAGCAVMAAALYLIRAIHEANLKAEVRLFEGFVSFKERISRSNHAADVCELRNIVKRAPESQESILSKQQLTMDTGDLLQSAFKVAGLDFGVPAVIVAKYPSPREVA